MSDPLLVTTYKGNRKQGYSLREYLTCAGVTCEADTKARLNSAFAAIALEPMKSIIDYRLEPTQPQHWN